MTPGTHPGATWEAPRTPAAWAVAAFAIAALIAGAGAGFAAAALPRPLLAVAGAVGLLVAVLTVADAGWARERLLPSRCSTWPTWPPTSTGRLPSSSHCWPWSASASRCGGRPGGSGP